MIKHVHIDVSDRADNLDEITAAGWSGRIFRLSRSAFVEWDKTGKNFPRTAVAYILYSDYFDKASFGAELYVGHSRQIDDRTRKHNIDKKFWTSILLFTSVGDWMNFSHTECVERVFIEWALKANRYQVSNGTEGSLTELGHHDAYEIQHFLAPICRILSMIGVDVFKENSDAVFTFEGELVAGNKYVSQLRIDDVSPQLSLIVLAGSEIYCGKDVSDNAKTYISSVGGVFNSDSNTVSFSKDAKISDAQCFGEQGLSFLGTSLVAWKSASKKSLRIVVVAMREKAVKKTY